MSIYGTWLTIEDERQVAQKFADMGIGHGVIVVDLDDEDAEEFSLEEGNMDDLPEDMRDAPIIYQGSHILPSDDDPRGGSVEVGAIPDFITRDGRDDAQGEGLKDWLRLGVQSEDGAYMHEGEPYVKGGDATVILTRPQVERLRDTLTAWLEREAVVDA